MNSEFQIILYGKDNMNIKYASTDLDRWSQLIKTMNIPKERIEPTESNLLWFLKSGYALNQKHKNVLDAVNLTTKILNKHESIFS